MSKCRPLVRKHALQIARLAAARAVLIVAALVILAGVVRGGTRFFYCPISQLAFDSPPCSQALDETSLDDDLQAPAVRAADCCQEKWRAAAPVASVPGIDGPSVAAASLVTVLPPSPRGMEIVAARMPFEVAHAVRAGPPPRSASERRAELMVFHN